ncbi:hypothetical protein AQI88_08300 [Streptomyces cellostaticus]|uniref:Major facilitator superfamily (MFS) profile domain-containing protein n=1 Tax=Streptomyces cellostaticus TaxID=67285 RepID=A0A124HDD6_9ACTN|nr:MFS transporter [Streptomyces cellostaticus]KUM97266.1 hypothetical protein AQI88_08300 [Streptomyces cellostaticus]GHI03941.1 MFS transporter [Streptomyces cellostaticus]
MSFTGIVMLTVGMVAPILPLYFKDAGIAVGENGALIAVSGFMSALAALFAGNAADRFDRKKFMGVSGVALGILPLGYLIAHSAGAFIALRVLQGLAAPLAGVAAQAILMELAQRSGHRGEVMGAERTVSSGTFVAGPIVGGAIGGLIALRAVFVFQACLIIAGTLLALLLLRGEEGPSRRPVKLLSLPEFMRDRVTLALLALLLFDFMNFQVLTFVLPLYGRDHGISAATVGLLITVQSLAYALLQGPVGKLADGKRAIPVLATCTVAGGPVVWLCSLTSNPWLIGGLMVLFGLASAPVFLVVMMTVADAAGERAGVAMGLINAVIYVAAGLAPLVSALLSEISIQQGFLAPVINSLLSIPLLVIVWRWAASPHTAEAGPEKMPENTSASAEDQ